MKSIFGKAILVAGVLIVSEVIGSPFTVEQHAGFEKYLALFNSSEWARHYTIEAFIENNIDIQSQDITHFT